jgi:hypothetical protein
MKYMKTKYALAVGVLTLAISSATAQETLEFEGPESARIYVLEGDFSQSATMAMYGGTWDVQTDMQSTMEVNSGAMTSAGQMVISGSGVVNGFDMIMNMDMAFAMKAVSKQAGDAVRWSGNAAMSGPMIIQVSGYPTLTASVSGIWAYKNITLDPSTGEQTGSMSYRARAVTTDGQRIPLQQPATVMTFPRPTIYASEGEWREVAGDWSTNIEANVYSNGKITGIGELTVGDPEDPYANVDQNVKGKINSKTGVVSLSGSGATKGTSKVKITLNYLDATGDTIDGKSSVNAYAQKRKF